MKKAKATTYEFEPYPMFLFRRVGKSCQSILVQDPDEHDALLEQDGEGWVEGPEELGFPPTSPSRTQSALMASGRNPNKPGSAPMPVDTGIMDLEGDGEGTHEELDEPVAKPAPQAEPAKQKQRRPALRKRSSAA